MQIRRNHHYRNSRNTHQAQAKVKRNFAQAFLDMKSVAVFVRYWEYMPIFTDKIATLLLFFTVKAFFAFSGGHMSDKKYKKEDCIILLKNKYRELQEEELSRYPQRSDFEDREVVAIKAFLGPWPRALEAAGIKPPRADDRAEKNKEKRIRAKRARNIALKEAERAVKKGKN